VFRAKQKRTRQRGVETLTGQSHLAVYANSAIALVGKDSHVEEIVAIASLIMIGHAAFDAAFEQYPCSRLTLRHGARVVLKYPEWMKRRRCLTLRELAALCSAR
jgi:hypothetical protein